jgi:NAD(P)-dependent dehydrogenase (short-subunit alcohol dehydrogenase family)
MDLKNRVALVTGTRRIGAVVATELAVHGADVAITYFSSRGKAEEVAASIVALGRRSTMIQADLSRASDCETAVAKAVEALGRLDVLVNMASIYVEKPLEETTEQDWDNNINVDLKSYYICSRSAIPHMRGNGGGRIINFSDWLSKSGRPRYKGYLPYYVAKAGVIGLTEALALELAEYNILVNAIAPGPIVAASEIISDPEYEAVEKATPLGHWGGEMEIAKAVISLIEADFITGETIRVDGGRHVK